MTQNGPVELGELVITHGMSNPNTEQETPSVRPRRRQPALPRV
jgi:hypothetical protein